MPSTGLHVWEIPGILLMLGIFGGIALTVIVFLRNLLRALRDGSDAPR